MDTMVQMKLSQYTLWLMTFSGILGIIIGGILMSILKISWRDN